MLNKLAKLGLLFLLALGVCESNPRADRRATSASHSKASHAASLREDLEKIFSDPQLAQAQLGVKVYSLDRSETLYEKNCMKLFIPASCNKLITAGAALIALGPEYRFETRVLTDGQIENGILSGNLIVVGSGDPSHSARFQEGDSFAQFKNWAARLKKMNVRSIAGDIIGDSSAFMQPSYGAGWEWEDLSLSYAAPVSALQFNDNSINLDIIPGPFRGSEASIIVHPLSDYPRIQNRVETVSEGGSAEISFESSDAIKEAIEARGTIPLKSPSVSKNISVRQPAYFYLSALKHVLKQEGIDVENCVIKEEKNRNASTSLLWTHLSPPLSEIVKPLLKDSLNLYAETLVRAMGLALKSEGSFAKGKEIVEEVLEKTGIKKEDFKYADGSGLSRQNLQSPETLTKVLRQMKQHQYFSCFYDALPIAGVDGTLAERMKNTKAENNARAKTGTLSNVSAIAGYVRSASGEMLAFAIMANNYPGKKTAAESAEDKAIDALAKFTRK